MFEENLVGLDVNSGCGGLALALAPWVRQVSYCEANRDAQAVLVSRMVGGDLPLGPIWDDVATLDGHFFGHGAIDIVSATVTGQGVGSGGRAFLEGKHTDILFEICRLADETRSQFVFVASHRAPSSRRLERFTRALADVGFDTRWHSLSTRDVGAPYDERAFFLLGSRPFNGKEWFSVERLSAEPKAERIDWQDARYWRHKPRMARVDERLSVQVGRNRAICNSVVPLLARTAFKTLIGIVDAAPQIEAMLLPQIWEGDSNVL